MRKKLTFLFALLCATTLTWAATVTLTLDKLGSGLTSTSNTSVATTNITATGASTDTYTLNYLGGKKQGDAILLAKGTSGGTSFISNKTAMPGDIQSVKVYINTGASGSATYHCAFSTTECTSRYVTGSTAQNITAGNNYTYNCSVSGARYFCIALGANYNGQILKVDVNYTSSGNSGPVDPTITFNNGIVRVGNTLDLSTLFSSNSEGAVTYSITEGGDYATLSGSTLTGVAVGNVTVQASQAAVTDTYNAKAVTATIQVKAAASAEAQTYTSAQGILTTTDGTSASTAKVVISGTQYDAIKCGVSGTAGAMKITVPAYATTLHLHAGAWTGETVVLGITGATADPDELSLTADAGIAGNSPFTLQNDPVDQYFSVGLSSITEETTLTLTATSGKRFVVYGVNYDLGEIPSSVVTISATNGTVTAEVDGNAIASGASVQAGKTVTLSHQAAANYEFEAWNVTKTNGGAAITVTNNQFTMPAEAVTISATFRAATVKYAVTISNAIENGSVVAQISGSNITEAAEGDVVTLVATADQGYQFSEWNVTKTNGGAAITVTNDQFTMPAEAVTVSATFVEPVLTIAEVIAAIGTSTSEGDVFKLNDVTVTYANGSNTYVKDATGSILIYSAIDGAANGKVLSGLKGKAKLYSKLPEISTVTVAPQVSDGVAVEPEVLNAFPTASDANKYVVLNGVTFSSAQTLTEGSIGNNITGTFKGTSLTIRNNFKIGATFATNTEYTIIGISSVYNSTIQLFPISYEAVTLSSIAVKTAPTTVVYTEGQTFDPAGLVITATYSNSTTQDIAYSGNEADFTFSPALNAALTITDDEVTITYGGKSTTQAITVNENTTPVIIPASESIAVAAAGEANGSLGLTYNHITVALVTAAVCTDAEGNTEMTPAEAWLTADISQDFSQLTYLVEENTAPTARTAYIKIEAVDDGSGYAKKIITLTQAGFVKGNTADNPYTVAEVKDLELSSAIADKWVLGYIVGSLSSKTAFANPAAATNIALADNQDETTASNTIPIQLPTGSIRNALNLLDNSGNVGKKLKIKGSLEAYFQTNGMKSPSDYVLANVITIADDIENGTVVADMTSAFEGETVTLTATPNANWYFSSYSVIDAGDNTITVTNNKFIMPATNVTISASFTNVPTSLDDVETGVAARKYIENGVLYIERDGKIYNVMGVQVK